MNLRHIFRRTRPTPAPPRLDPGEAMIISAYEFTEAEWSALTDYQRADFRDFYMKVTMP